MTSEELFSQWFENNKDTIGVIITIVVLGIATFITIGCLKIRDIIDEKIRKNRPNGPS